MIVSEMESPFSVSTAAFEDAVRTPFASLAVDHLFEDVGIVRRLNEIEIILSPWIGIVVAASAPGSTSAASAVASAVTSTIAPATIVVIRIATIAIRGKACGTILKAGANFITGPREGPDWLQL